jgi:hypothetical protein
MVIYPVYPVGVRPLATTLVITGEVITLEMGPGSQKAKNTIGPDLKSFLGMRLSTLKFQYRSSIPRAFLDHHTKQSKMIQLAGCAANFFRVAASG